MSGDKLKEGDFIDAIMWQSQPEKLITPVSVDHMADNYPKLAENPLLLDGG